MPHGLAHRSTLRRHVDFLCVGNPGNNSIAGFAVDPATGNRWPPGMSTEAVPRAFALESNGPIALDPDDRYRRYVAVGERIDEGRQIHEKPTLKLKHQGSHRSAGWRRLRQAICLNQTNRATISGPCRSQSPKPPSNTPP